MATITVSELATELDANPREVRKFLRSITPADAQPGKGSRWAIEKRSVRGLKKTFSAWQAERTPEVPADDADALDDAPEAPDAE